MGKDEAGITEREGRRCAECIKEGERSRLYEPTSWVSAPFGEPERYYDEDGKYHIHDRNLRSGLWYCSRGHQWSETVRHVCPQGDFPSP